MTVFSSSIRRIARHTGMALCAVILTACGGDSAPEQNDPLAPFTRQQLDWQVCDPGVQPESSGLGRDSLADARCALMRVPLDYDHPDGGELQIELMRVAARQPQQRLGAIVFNPGGPGGDGVRTGLAKGRMFVQSGNARLLELVDRFDLVGFSPRGTGASSRLTCEISSERMQLAKELTKLQGLGANPGQQLAQRYAELEVRDCLRNPLSRHVHTDGTARDMDVLRAVLGEDKLNFIGYSYGTWLGAWYSRLFPQHVGRMLLDSSVDIDSPDQSLTPSSFGKQRVLDHFMLPLAERKKDTLGFGERDVRQRLLALDPKIRWALMENIDFSRSDNLQVGVLAMAAALFVEELREAHPEAAEDELEALTRQHSFAGDKYSSAYTVRIALKILEGLAEAEEEDDDDTIEVDKDGVSDAVHLSVSCNDTESKRDAQYWWNLDQQDKLRYPMFDEPASNFCVGWSAPRRSFPPAPEGTSMPLLMLQARYDGITPVEGAQATLAALPQARMIVVEDEYQHGLFPYGTACVDNQVADYFLHGTLPQRLGSCAAKQQY